MKIVSGSANPGLAKKIAQALNLRLTPLEIFIFPDGERRVQVQERVVDEDCVVVQPTSPVVDTNYIELFLIVDALKRSGARNVTVVMPYVGYQRQDHIFRDGEAVSMDVMIKTVESLGLTKIIVFDLHSIKIPELFHVPLVHLSALPLFAEKIRALCSQQGPASDITNTVLISPDMGGIRRIKILSELLDNMPYANVIKNRDLATGSITSGGIDAETSTISQADLAGKHAIVVDDMISSGGTIVEAAQLLKKLDVSQVSVFVTHAIFSAKAPTALQNSAVDNVYVTDSVLVPEEKRFKKLEIISIANMIGKEITS